jgi:hypothetical protein
MRNPGVFMIVSIVCLLGSPSARCGDGGIGTKVLESLQRQFGDSAQITKKTLLLTPGEIARIVQASRSSWPSDTVTVYVCTRGETITGYGIVDIVRGKVQPFTYLVGLTRGGEVNDIDVLEYREAYGGEIAYQSFRAQFNKKTSRDELTPGRTIKNVSGATISVRSITSGIRRVLATFAIIQPRL